MNERSPMIWVSENRLAWDNPSNLDFGNCVRKQSPEDASWKSVPDTPQGRRVAALLETKLGRYLIAKRCSGTGPDDCLTLLDALLSLNPRSEFLPEVFAALAPHFPPLDFTPLYPLVSNDTSVEMHKSLAYKRAEARRVLMGQLFYLTEKLRMFAAQDNRVIPEKLEATLIRLIPVARLLDKLEERIFFVSMTDGRYEFSNPWEPIYTNVGNPLWDQAFVTVGGVAASRDMTSCEMPNPRRELVPATYWRGYWAASVLAGKKNCATANQNVWIEAYSEAKSDTDLSLEFSLLRGSLGDEARADQHLAVVSPLISRCPLDFDPWDICVWSGKLEHRLKDRSLRSGALPPTRQRFREESLVFRSFDNMSPEVVQNLQLAQLQRRDAAPIDEIRTLLKPYNKLDYPTLVARWWHPDSPVRALLLNLPFDPENENWSRALITYGKGYSARLIRLPGGFGQYDEGVLATLTDLDRDGRLELWFSGEFGECDGEDSVPGKDCAVTEYDFGGEIFGDQVGPYISGHPQRLRR